MPKQQRPEEPKIDSDLTETESQEIEQSGGGAYLAIQMPLIRLIEEYLLDNSKNNKRMTIKNFCDESGILIGVMTAILNGNRWVAKCNRTTVEKLAKTLGISVLQIYILSGFIKTEDVIFNADIDETVNAIYRKMVKDKSTSFKAPSEEVWNSWPTSAKLTVCMLYEALIAKFLFRYGA